jgi:hypothetical protein
MAAVSMPETYYPCPQSICYLCRRSQPQKTLDGFSPSPHRADVVRYGGLLWRTAARSALDRHCRRSSEHRAATEVSNLQLRCRSHNAMKRSCGSGAAYRGRILPRTGDSVRPSSRHQRRRLSAETWTTPRGGSRAGNLGDDAIPNVSSCWKKGASYRRRCCTMRPAFAHPRIAVASLSRWCRHPLIADGQRR